MKRVLQVVCVVLAAPAYGLDDGGGWVLHQSPSPIHVERYTTRGGGLSFADCGVIAKCDEVGASGWGQSYLGSGHATHQDAANGWIYESYLWTGEGSGRVRFEGRAHTNEGWLRSISGKASIALTVSVEIESAVTPVIRAEAYGRVSNFGPGGWVGAEAGLPGPIPVTVTASAPTSAPSTSPHVITIPEATDQKLGENCLATFDWQVQTHAESELYVEWVWFGGIGYARGDIPAGGNADVTVTLGGPCGN